MKKKYTSKTIVILIAAICLAGYMFPALHLSAYADTSLNYDRTDVLDDLRDTETINLSDYPADENGTLQVISFVEYCYSYRANLRANYGLYVYVYNPQVLDIDISSMSNTIQMAVAYGKDIDGNTVAQDYESFNLKFCTMSTEPNHYRLFYKFKVVDRVGSDGKKIVERVNSAVRRYDVSGIELLEKGKQTAEDYPVAWTYEFSGYAKGYGLNPEADSNLSVRMYRLETILLNVKDTFYRTGISDSGKDHQNQLNSVYFAVDNDVLEKYGNLQKVKAMWYEYKTKPIIITHDMDVYASLFSYLGQSIDIGENGKRYNSDIPYGLYYHRHSGAGHSILFDWSYNDKGFQNENSIERAEMLTYLFSTNGVNAKDYTLSSDDLKDWIYAYDKSFNSGYLPIKGGTISADLFENDVDEGRTYGYNLAEIDAGDRYNLLSYDSSHNFWDRWADYGLWTAIFGDSDLGGDIPNIEPIKKITTWDMLATGAGLAKNLLIYEDDVIEFREYYNLAISKKDTDGNAKKQQTVFLFRYAVTDYVAGELETYNYGNGKTNYSNGTYAQETVFLDFDIIQLTFHKDGNYHVIPVVSNPIDIVAAITPPLDIGGGLRDFWQTILALLMLILLIVLLAPFLPLIVRALIWLITLPFKVLGGIYKGLKKSFKQRK